MLRFIYGLIRLLPAIVLGEKQATLKRSVLAMIKNYKEEVLASRSFSLCYIDIGMLYTKLKRE